MNRLKSIFLLLFSLLTFGIFLDVKADTIPNPDFEVISELVLKENKTGVIYEFENLETREQFLKSRNITPSNASSFRSYGVGSVRRTYLSSYRDTAVSGRVSYTVYGGSSGASVSISSGQSFSSSEYGIGFTYGSAATHFVPPYKYGYIVLKASFTVNIYKLEVKYQGTNEWRPAGRIKTFSNTNVWTELRTYS